MIRSRRVVAVVASVLAMAGLAACSGSAAGSDATHLSLVAFSVPKPAYDALQAGFAATPQGRGVTWGSSYGASGTQSLAVANGQPADVVAFSLAPDVTRLVPKVVDANWDAGGTKGIVSSSVVVIAVRKGNPKHITGWADLVKPGIKIVTPDPASSGSAKWNVLAAYTHVLAEGGSDAQATQYLRQFFAHVVAKPASGAAATTTFLNGTGDALISYENEAIAARQKGQSLDYVVPAESLLIENPIAVTAHAPQAAKDFLAYAESSAGQKIFAAHGFRPVVRGVDVGTVAGASDPARPFPAVATLTTIAGLGGWRAVNAKYFAKPGGIVTQIDGGGR